MDRRLVALALAVPAAVFTAALVPAGSSLAGLAVSVASLAAALLIPTASLAWALRAGPATWAVAMAPGALAVAAQAPDGLAAYAASVLAGPVVAWMRRTGRSPGRALLWGVVPFAVWTVGLTFSGFEPLPGEAAEMLESSWSDPSLADLPPERLAEIRATSETLLEVLRRTWVASEIVWFWVTLVAAWWFLGRIGARSAHPDLGRFAALDVADAWVGVLILGLALVLVGARGVDAAATVGWNLVFGSGFVFVLRGVAIEVYWMDRAGWRRPARAAVLVAALALALPVFAVVAAGLGLFDAWFDFRRRGETP